MSTADPQAAYAQGGAGDPAAGGVDPAAFTPEQWQAYQQAYAQAMHAQQMYAQAQQAYAQAEQAGQADVAQQAYAQATQAQQMYAQAHQTYLAILQQVQGQAGGQVPVQGQDPAQAAQQQAYEQQMAMQQQAQQQAYEQQMAQQQAYEQQMAQQQAYEQQMAMQQAQAAQQAQMYAQQGYDPQMQGQDPQAMAMQQQAMQQQAMQQGYDPQQAMAMQQAQQQAYEQQMAMQQQAQAAQQQMYAQSQQSMQGMAQVGEPMSGDPLSTADWDEAYYDDSAAEHQGGGGAIWFWIIGIGTIVGSIIALHFATQPPPKLDDPYGEKASKKSSLTPEEREKRRRMMLGLDKEQNSRYLRPVFLSMKKRKWSSAAVAGKGECRTIYFADKTGVYAAEANAPKEDKDYLKKIHPDYPFNLRKLPLPMRTLSRQLVTGPGGSYLLLRAQIARQSWMLVYPLVGNPLKGKGSKRGAECGESGRTPDSFLDKRNLVLLGEGSCSLANDTLGVKPRLCLSGITVPTRAPLWFWQQGRRLSPPKGYLLLGTNLVKVKRRAKPKTVADIYGTLQRSSMPSFDRHRKGWMAVERGSRSIWTFDPRGPKPTGIEVPLLTKDAVRILVTKKHVRVVYPTRMIKFARVSRTTIRKEKIYPFGKNVKVTHASWDRAGHILLLITKKQTVYQFSENP